MKVWTIYCHTNRFNGKQYVGQTEKTIEWRWREHLYEAKRFKKKKWCSAFHAAIRKYGPDAFKHAILDTVSTQKDANTVERARIRERSTLVPGGYNLQSGGGAGRSNHPDTRTKLSVGQTLFIASLTPAERVDRARRAAVMLTIRANMTPEERSEVSRRSNAALSREQRSEKSRDAQWRIPFQIRSATALARQAAMTPEQRSEAARKRWRNRRAKAAAAAKRARS